MLADHLRGILNSVTCLLVGAGLFQDMGRQHIAHIVRPMREKPFDRAAPGPGIEDAVALNDEPPGLIECVLVIGGRPIGPGFVNILARDQPFDFLEMIADVRRLPELAGFLSVQGGGALTPRRHSDQSWSPRGQDWLPSRRNSLPAADNAFRSGEELRDSSPNGGPLARAPRRSACCDTYRLPV